jgi:hypothetical protein
MISAATQTLAEFFAKSLARLGRGDISFDHPQVFRSQGPCLNLYCYRIQGCPQPAGADVQDCRWFNLTFLVSASDHTSLGEQNLLSEVLETLQRSPCLPDQVIEPCLRGQGALAVRVSTQAAIDDLLLWKVLQTPLKLALHVTMTVPCVAVPCVGAPAMTLSA